MKKKNIEKVGRVERRERSSDRSRGVVPIYPSLFPVDRPITLVRDDVSDKD